MHPSEFFRGSTITTPDRLLRDAHADAVADAHAAAAQLSQAVSSLCSEAPGRMFAVLAERAAELSGSFNATHPDIELLNVTSRAHHIALLNGLHADLFMPLRALAAAQDKLDEAYYIVRQYARSTHGAAVLAAGLRMGSWQYQECLAKTTSVRSVICVDLSATKRLAAIANCPVALISALDRLFVAEAIAVAASAGCAVVRQQSS